MDILGLDTVLLNMVPSPCAGVILLFPCTDKMFDVRQAQKQRLLAQAPSPATNAAYHVKQVAEFGNACGTIASVHALINGQVVYQNKKVKNSAMQKFRDANANASPQDRGRALLKTSALRSSSDQSAGHRSAQTACPDVRIFFCFCQVPMKGRKTCEEEKLNILNLTSHLISTSVVLLSPNIISLKTSL